MRSIVAAICLVVFSAAAFSQQGAGGLFGIVSDQAPHYVASAPIEARNIDTGMVFHGESSSVGVYRLTGLPPGTYEVSVSVTGVGNVFRQQVKIAGSAPLRFDIILPLS